MDKDEDGPERTCVVTRRKASPDAMLRFVAGPDGAIIPDLRRRQPGRGVWVTATAGAVAEAVKKGAFARSLKAKVQVAPDLPRIIDALLMADTLQSLGMANKAGAVMTGFFKVEAALAAGPVAALLHATEAAEDGIRKLDNVRRRRERGNQASTAGGADRDTEDMIDREGAAIKVFSSEQLDLALGRTNVIHAALANGPAGQAFLLRCRRLVQYRPATTSGVIVRVEPSA